MSFGSPEAVTNQFLGRSDKSDNIEIMTNLAMSTVSFETLSHGECPVI